MSKETRWLLEEKYHGHETPEFAADILRLEAGEPLAYVIGWVDFLGCRIDLSARPLIPRPETEFWVETAIKAVSSKQLPVASQNNSLKILDLFSGSGCIGVALLKHLPNAMVDFGEKDPNLCTQIEKNIAQNNIEVSRSRVLQTDVFSRITDIYDYIFANPPYIDPTKKETVEGSVLLHEPHKALFAENNGLAFIHELLANGRDRLAPTGTMYVEFGENQKEDIALLAQKTSWSVEFSRDQFGVWRVAKLLPH